MTAITLNQTTYNEARENSKTSEMGSFFNKPQNGASFSVIVHDINKDISGEHLIGKQSMGQISVLPKIVISTFIVSIFFALFGALSLLFFLVKDVYFIHPYVAPLSFIGGSFLFSSSLLAVKGK